MRKEFKARNENRRVYETELRNLSILKLLRHQNIVECLGSYAYQERLNLVFRQAHGGTLAHLLSAPRPPFFTSDNAILVALSGLCSAVCAVHDFVSSDHSLELIGCHHDLKPANILVEGSRFLLADFGLSRFKDISEHSDTLSRTVHPYYTPPECCKPEDGLGKPIVHRSSDIWSLGCITAEVVTYMLHGAQGVTDFENRRVFEMNSIVRHRFHRGGVEEPAVTAWFEELQRSSSRTYRMLGSLVEEMLQLRPDDRPRAQEVEAKVRFIMIDAICQPCHELYNDLCNKSNCIQATLERTRFDSWRYACKILEFDNGNPLGQWNDRENHQLFQEIVSQMHQQLQAILPNCQNPKSLVFQPLRQLNDLLIDRLSHEGQSRASVYLDTQMMSNASDTLALAQMAEGDPSMSQARRLSIWATVKCMTEVLQGRPSHDGSIDRSKLEKDSRIGDFKIGYLRAENEDDKCQVLVESKTYQEHYGNTKTATELQKRLEEITVILKTANCGAEEERFQVLPCAGFYQDPATFSCGLVYEFPTPKKQTFTTLRLALENTRHELERQPSLEQRFQLAHMLASSVLKFHTVSWLQKSISSFNVAFFHPSNASWLNGIADPKFLGYLHSRSNDANAFTEGPTDDTLHQDYQHPEYRENNLRYRAEYDYYSLGIILLEIGLWKPLDKIFEALAKLYSRLDRLNGRSTPQLDRICQGCVPRLRISMGSRYQRVVETCLRGRFEVPDNLGEKERHSKLQRGFLSLVVEKLAECKV